MAMNDGGPAFPVNLRMLEGGLSGMTMRQWYKGQAMQGLAANTILTAIMSSEHVTAEEGQGFITVEEVQGFITFLASGLADKAVAEDAEHAAGGTP